MLCRLRSERRVLQEKQHICQNQNVKALVVLWGDCAVVRARKGTGLDSSIKVSNKNQYFVVEWF